MQAELAPSPAGLAGAMWGSSLLGRAVQADLGGAHPSLPDLSILEPPCHILPSLRLSWVNVTGTELAQPQVLSSWLPRCWGGDRTVELQPRVL